MMKWVVTIAGRFGNIIEQRSFQDQRKARDYYAESLAKYYNYDVFINREIL